MENGPGWLPDPEDAGLERYWNGTAWTDRVRPAGRAGALHLPEHVPDLQRALAAATADIDAVEERLSTMFDRTEGRAARPGPPAETPPPLVRESGGAQDAEARIDHGEQADTEPVDREPFDAPYEPFDAPDEEDDGAFAELDAALAAEEPETSKRGLFRRRG